MAAAGGWVSGQGHEGEDKLNGTERTEVGLVSVEWYQCIPMHGKNFSLTFLAS